MNSSIISYIPKETQAEKNKLEQEKLTSWKKEQEKMDRLLRNCTDEIIRRYHKYRSSQYELNPTADLPDHEIASFIDTLYQNDPATTEFLNTRMEELIEERIGWVFAEDMVEKGLTPIRDKTNNEITWIRK